MKTFYSFVSLAVLLHSATVKAQADLCQNGNEFEPHPDCTLYYICDNGVPTVQECPPELYWSTAIGACDFPSLVPECVGGTRAPETTQTTTAATTTTPTAGPTTTASPVTGSTVRPGQCPPTGVVMVAHESDCRKYYLCVEGVKTDEFTCSEGLFFDPKLQECNFAEEVDCAYSPSEPATGNPTTTSNPITTTSRPGPEPTCTNDLELFPYPGDCSLYYRCFNSVPVVSFCPTGQLFDTARLTCLPASEAQCTVRK